MKKTIMVLMIAFTMMTGLFADVTLIPKDEFNNCIVPAYNRDAPFVHPQIAYVADTWEDVYERTGVDKYDWEEVHSTYCDCTGYQLLLIIKCEDEGGLWWMCLEYPGDGSVNQYVADLY